MAFDTTKQMQDVNEAYLILKDAEARIRYNQEYEHFVKSQSKYQDEDHINPKSEYSTNQESYDYEDYEFEDEILKYWVKNAQRQAGTYVKEITSLSANATKAAGTEMLQWFLGYLILGIIITIIFLLINNF